MLIKNKSGRLHVLQAGGGIHRLAPVDQAHEIDAPEHELRIAVEASGGELEIIESERKASAAGKGGKQVKGDEGGKQVKGDEGGKQD